MTEEGKKLLKLYNKQYREANRERIRQTHNDWQKSNPDKVKAYRDRYWDKKAGVISD